MIKDRILAAYEQLSERYNELIDHKPHNAYYDRPNTLRLIPDVKGKKVLDAACGPGKYAEILISQGAELTAFDFSPKMVELAKRRNCGQGHFFVHDLSAPLNMLESQSFDIILCTLALQYIADWSGCIQEFHRLLKDGGMVVISTEHPFFEFNYFQSNRYFEVEHVQCNWKGFGETVEVNSYRRPLSECISPFTENGFYIDQLIEPKPTKEFEALDPKHYEELNAFPAFMCMRAIKR